MSVAITGGAGGLGVALGRAFAARGRPVLLLDNSPAVEQTAREIASEAGRSDVVGLRCDVRESESIEAAWEHAAASIGPIDVVVNNAGRFVSARTAAVSDADWATTIAINLSGAFFMCRAAARRGVPSDRGRAWSTCGSWRA